MRERDLEMQLVGGVRSLGGRCEKWTSAGVTGLPDRIVLLPGGRVAFVELKRPGGGHIGKLQHYWRRKLTELGFRHYFIRSPDDLHSFLEDMTAWEVSEK